MYVSENSYVMAIWAMESVGGVLASSLICILSFSAPYCYMAVADLSQSIL